MAGTLVSAEVNISIYCLSLRIDNKHMTEPWLDQALMDSEYESNGDWVKIELRKDEKKLIEILRETKRQPEARETKKCKNDRRKKSKRKKKI